MNRTPNRDARNPSLRFGFTYSDRSFTDHRGHVPMDGIGHGLRAAARQGSPGARHRVRGCYRNCGVPGLPVVTPVWRPGLADRRPVHLVSGAPDGVRGGIPRPIRRGLPLPFRFTAELDQPGRTMPVSSAGRPAAAGRAGRAWPGCGRCGSLLWHRCGTLVRRSRPWKVPRRPAARPKARAGSGP